MPTRPASPAAPPGRRLVASVAAGIVFVVALLPTIWGLGAAPLARTEPHRVIPAHAMVATGDWLVPRLYGVPYLRKPPLHYWILAAHEWLTGSTAEWVYRLPSALAGALTCVAAALAAQRWFGRGGRRAAFAAGLGGGIVCFALVPLWAQWRSADVDASSTLFGAVAALAIVEIGRRRGRRGAAPSLVAAAAFGAAALVKGPACLPTVVGAVAAATWLAGAGPRARGRTLAWCGGAIVAGSLLFAAWGLAALRSASGPGGFDWSGVQEAIDRADGDTATWATRALVPLLVLVYGLPATLVAFVAGRREVRAVLGARAARVAAALIVAWLVAAVVGVVGGVDNPRYAYGTLVPLAPLGGAIAAVAVREAWPASVQRALRAALTMVAAACAAVAAAIWLRMDGGDLAGFAASPAVAPWLGVVAAAAAAAVTTALWIAQRVRPALAGTVVSLAILAIAFGDQRNASRRGIASFAAAQQLRSVLVGAGPADGRPRVVAGMWVMNGPELFRYADVDVTYFPGHIVEGTPLSPGDWVVFQREEWAALSPGFRTRFTEVTDLAVRSRNAILARFAE